jgi:hypothetical protein
VLKIMYGSWEESFGLLYSWKVEVMSKMPDNVIEIDVVVKEGIPYFRRSFCALAPCIKGFLEGCRPYLAIDSTTLNGRWNDHLAGACSVNGHCRYPEDRVPPHTSSKSKIRSRVCLHELPHTL